MTDTRSEGNDRDTDRSRPSEREREPEPTDELARRRDQARLAQLTSRERQERWPIG
jgi:hypothetical protein